MHCGEKQGLQPLPKAVHQTGGVTVRVNVVRKTCEVSVLERVEQEVERHLVKS